MLNSLSSIRTPYRIPPWLCLIPPHRLPSPHFVFRWASPIYSRLPLLSLASDFGLHWVFISSSFSRCQSRKKPREETSRVARLHSSSSFRLPNTRGLLPMKPFAPPTRHPAPRVSTSTVSGSTESTFSSIASPGWAVQQAALSEGPQMTQALKVPMRFRREKSGTRDVEWVFKSVSSCRCLGRQGGGGERSMKKIGRAHV